jgi:hypothetical protein
MPGFEKTFIQEDTSFKIIRVPQNQEMTLTLKQESTGLTWNKIFTTNASSKTLNIGELPGSGDLYVVADIVAYDDGTNIKVNWKDMDYDKFAGVKITYNTVGKSDHQSFDVTKGIETATISGLPRDGSYYEIIVQAKYTDGNIANGVKKIVKLAKTYTLAITLQFTDGYYHSSDPNPNQRITIKENGATNGYYYIVNNPVTYPSGTTLKLEVRQEDFYPLYWEWTINNTQSGFDNDVSLTMNEDYNILLSYSQGSN